MRDFLDHGSLEDPLDRFEKAVPFPWVALEGVLFPEAFARLRLDFPSLSLFECHQGLPRAGGQRPHNRFYLAYESSIYTHLEHRERGIARRDQLPEAWQAFLRELE